MFKVLKKSKVSGARLGLIKTEKGDIATPFFMPDATRGVIKGLANEELKDLGLECFVANTLHLYLRPGLKFIKAVGGLNKFTGWPGPFLTDSGGYQIFSLIHKSKNGGKITDAGAIFRSPLDGAEIKLTPKDSIKTQLALGADFVVCLDDCPPNDYAEKDIKDAVDRTIKWARVCRAEFDRELKRRRGIKPLLFAVIQGGNNLALRRACADGLKAIGFDGFGFGARHVDAAGNFLGETLKQTAAIIPEDKLRFGLGVGLPEDIVAAAKMGWDMFDCVIPTREGRHGKLFVFKNNFSVLLGRGRDFYDSFNVSAAKFARDFSPINPASQLNELRSYSKSYLNYLFKIRDPLAGRLASLHNLEFYLKILAEVRRLIKLNKF